nr:hypothetical protein [Lachnospiraceae bacterium]
MAEEPKKVFNDLKEGAKGAFQAVKEETQEVVQEAKATATGQKLDSAGTVGGAGYRADNSKTSVVGIFALVLGILSIVCAWFGYGAIAGVIFGIVGIVLGAMGRKQAQTGVATAGFVCSLIGLILSAVRLVCVIACVAAVNSALK